ncbi:MAG: hypothetical protein JWN14_26 [Chthonomonadales bacterium]|nr:hypothetical protein [Chthonomonadales bacterium]
MTAQEFAVWLKIFLEACGPSLTEDQVCIVRHRLGSVLSAKETDGEEWELFKNFLC